MAEFKVQQLEGTQYVEAHLEDESVQAEAGALSYLTGRIDVRSQVIPSPRRMLRSLLADEAVFRPIYTGTGVVTFESSLGGFHVLQLSDETWILEPGAYWASDGTVDVSFHRESVSTAFWSGEGLVYLQTRVTGPGKVVVTTRGPVEEIVLEPGQRFVAQDRCVICRTREVPFKLRRATKNWWGRFTAGEGLVRVYEGPGRLLLNPAPYWRYKIFADHGSDLDYPARAAI